MIVSDLESVHYRAEIIGGKIRVGDFEWTPEDFVLSGIVLVDYDAEEERQLRELGLLAPIVPAGSPLLAQTSI